MNHDSPPDARRRAPAKSAWSGCGFWPPMKAAVISGFPPPISRKRHTPRYLCVHRTIAWLMRGIPADNERARLASCAVAQLYDYYRREGHALGAEPPVAHAAE